MRTMLDTLAFKTAAFDPALSPVKPSEIRAQHSTLHAIGLEWDMKGNFNHNNTVNVVYCAVGQSDWHDEFTDAAESV